MSRRPRVPQDNNALLHQINASIRADVNAFNAIGTDNAQWISISLGGSNQVTNEYTSTSVVLRTNIDGTDTNWLGIIDLPTNKGSHKLYIKSIRAGLLDADAGDYINAMYIHAYDTHANRDNLYQHNASKTTIDEHVWTGAGDAAGALPVDVSGYKQVYLWINAVHTNAADLAYSYIQIQYYYDTA